jgi:hypothetical protein
MRELTIAFDISSSLLKAIYATDDPSGEIKLLTLPVEVMGVSPEWIEARSRANVLTLHDEGDIHVRIGRSHYAMGRLATERFGACDSLREVKVDRGIVRTVAAVGAIALRERYPESFRLKLGVLLPYGEIGDRDTFEREARTALKEFEFKGREYRVELTGFSCLPEGSGVLMRGKTIPKRLRDCDLLTLSIGYRNASYLLFQGGKIVEGGTSALGFHALLEDIVSMTSGGVSAGELLPLALAYKEYKRRNLSNREFIKSAGEILKKTVRRERDFAGFCQKLVQNIRLADEGYWSALSNWLNTRKFPPVDEVILTGGTANYLRDELGGYFQSDRISWGDNIERMIRGHLVSEDEYLEKYRYRLTDNLGFFFFLKYETCRV